jgi:hypothetical protein
MTTFVAPMTASLLFLRIPQGFFKKETLKGRRISPGDSRVETPRIVNQTKLFVQYETARGGERSLRKRSPAPEMDFFPTLLEKKFTRKNRSRKHCVLHQSVVPLQQATKMPRTMYSD